MKTSKIATMTVVLMLTISNGFAQFATMDTAKDVPPIECKSQTIGDVTFSGRISFQEVGIVIRNEGEIVLENGVYRVENPRKVVDWDLSNGTGTYTLSATVAGKSYEAKGKILDIGADILVCDKEGKKLRTIPVAVAVGEFLCYHPDYAQQAIVTSSEVVSTKFPDDVGFFENATPSSFSDRFLTFKGVGFFALDGDENSGEMKGFDTSIMFAPGRKWRVANPLKFGYADRVAKNDRVLKPGTYIIGPHGVPEAFEEPAKK